ncbi:family 43 glycosylhydrolase [Niabella hibiscisoli]|nr:family 43 glycosylhydrolase [Niabella hibiscisoli]MCH5717954.1 family 43 glycosylhydrolase [Niabella hibiscisoli]
MKVLFVILVYISSVAGSSAAAQTDTLPKWGYWQSWGSQENDTYANPILPADYSDLDCIRVEDDYYAISSTFQYSPGMIVLSSKDLINWKIVSHVVEDLKQISPELNWDRMSRYGRGIWAGAIRYHANKFWVYFGTPDEGYFMSTAKRPKDPGHRYSRY